MHGPGAPATLTAVINPSPRSEFQDALSELAYRYPGPTRRTETRSIRVASWAREQGTTSSSRTPIADHGRPVPRR
jgi:hypothetical protein